MQQQTRSRKEIVRNKPLTPIEILLADKIDIEEKCRVQEKKLNEDFAYIQDNATNIILSGISTLLFPSKNTTQQPSLTGQKAALMVNSDNVEDKSPSLSVSDYFTIAKSLLPVAWGILQPIIITWGIKKAKSMLLGLLSGKKNTTLRK